MRGRSLRRFTAAALLLVAACPARAQSVLLDRPVRAGELVVFPEVNDPNAYHYVVDKPRLATDAAGRPQFSFLRYVENVRSGPGQTEARTGQGGGIVHAVVALGVSPEQVAAAQRELQRSRPSARLVAPLVFESGRVGLVSSFADPKAGLSTHVVGIGRAPLLDGQKAAVSIQLTRLGAQLLWESFQTATPDVTFSFEMDLRGYRSPARAVVEADFDRLHEHRAFGAAAATTLLAGEIRAAFDDLRGTGAIRVTQVGSDAAMEAILATAYGKLTELMFTPAGSGASEPRPVGAASAPSLLERASTMLAEGRAKVAAGNERVRAENAEALERSRRSDEAVRAARAEAAGGSSRGSRADSAGASKRASDSAGEQRARERSARASRSGDDLWGSPMAPSAPLRTEALAAAEREADRTAEAETSASTPALKQEEALPSGAVLASYELRQVRQRGTFKLDLDRFTTDRLTLRFDENIGDLRRLTSDAAHFRQVNLDDPLYKQRELAVFVDGLNAKDFGDYINFVSVRLRKPHANGEVSTDEVRIDRENFNREGNQFRLLYGWKGDTDSRRWMDYEFQTTWSFFGGAERTEAWRKASAGALALAAPLERRTVELQADAAALASAQVRSLTVRLYYRLGETEHTQSVTLDAARQPLARHLEFMQPAGSQAYEYEIAWQLKGNRSVSSGRRRGESAILFVDEVPAEGAGR